MPLDSNALARTGNGPQQGRGLSALGGNASIAFAKVQQPSAISQAEIKEADTPRIGFIIDHTGSRAATWQAAQVEQERIFSKVQKEAGAKIRMLHFGGDTLRDTKWQTDPKAVITAMHQSECETGETQLCAAMNVFSEEADAGPKPKFIIMIGDCCEEDRNSIEEAAERLATHKIPVFAFLEGHDPEGRWAFERIAKITKGVFMPFNKVDLGPIYAACAAFATGGLAALENAAQKGSGPALAMHRQLKMLPPGG